MGDSSPINETIHNLGYHRPKEAETQERMEAIRAAAREFAYAVNNNTMHCRETQMAYRAIEDATMYAIAGLARNEEATLQNLKERGK